MNTLPETVHLGNPTEDSLLEPLFRQQSFRAGLKSTNSSPVPRYLLTSDLQ